MVLFDTSVALEMSTAYTSPIRSGRVTVPFSPIGIIVVLRPERSARHVPEGFASGAGIALGDASRAEIALDDAR